MSKRKRRKDNSRQRDNNNIASTSLLHNTVYSLLSDIEDARHYSPERVRPAKGLSKGAARIIAGPSRSLRSLSNKVFAPDVFKFNKPHNVAVCVRRQRRKEVLFALKRNGKGSRSRRRRNAYSDISCR